MNDSNSQKYCLRWNNFQSNFLSQFEALKDDEDFVDVTMSCSGQSMKAHKVVLSACSPYLKSIFKEHPCKHPVIILDNISFKNLEAVMQFVYTGQVYVEQTELSSFLKTAETLQIRGLSDPSTTQSLVEPNQFQHSESEIIRSSRKRVADCEDNEIKKSSSKRISMKKWPNQSADSEEFKVNEKDWFSNNEIKTERNSYNSSGVNTGSEIDYTLDNDEGGVSRNEEYSTGDQKKPHWLDPRSCPLCNRVYSNLSNLRQHMKLIHNPTLVTCKLCFKTFKTDLYLRRHLMGFHDINVIESIDQFKPVRNQPRPSWNQNIKTEPEAFNDVINTDEMHQVPQ